MRRAEDRIVEVELMPEHATSTHADVAVLGAGMAGVSTAYAARRRGLAVTVLGARPPGFEPRFGNSGVLSSGETLPLNKPALWPLLPKYLTNTNPALRWDPVW